MLAASTGTTPVTAIQCPLRLRLESPAHSPCWALAGVSISSSGRTLSPRPPQSRSIPETWADPAGGTAPPSDLRRWYTSRGCQLQKRRVCRTVAHDVGDWCRFRPCPQAAEGGAVANSHVRTGGHRLVDAAELGGVAPAAEGFGLESGDTQHGRGGRRASLRGPGVRGGDFGDRRGPRRPRAALVAGPEAPVAEFVPLRYVLGLLRGGEAPGVAGAVYRRERARRDGSLRGAGGRRLQ